MDAHLEGARQLSPFPDTLKFYKLLW
jgi:hypothetical protein